MYWFSVIFVLMLMNQLDIIQSKVNGTDGDGQTTTEIEEMTSSRTLSHSCRDVFSNITGYGCRNETDIRLHFVWNEFSEKNNSIAMVEQENHNQNCYKFTKEGEFFTANTSGSFSNCNYLLLPYPQVYMEASSLDSLQSECPHEEEVCISEIVQSSACPLENFTVISKLHKGSHNYINLHLSWKKINQRAEINIISSKNSYNNCLAEFRVFNHSLLNNSLVKPALVTHDEVEPGCEYDIQFIFDRYKCSYNYTVPEYVDGKYDCEKFKPIPTILSIEYISDYNFFITWDPGEKTPYNHSYKIKQLEFKVLLTSKFFEIYAEPAKELKFNLEERTSEIFMKLLDGENYTLIGEFTNNFSCVSTARFHFTANIKGSNINLYIIAAVVTAVLVILIMFQFKKIICKRYWEKLLNCVVPGRRARHDITPLRQTFIPLKENIQYTPVEIMGGNMDEYEFPRNKIIMKEVIGSGAFGEVHLAKALGISGTAGYTMVAVKTLGGEYVTKEATNDFVAEIEIFKQIGRHRNIVSLLGCCTLDPPYLMIMEFVPCGDLKKYLLELRQQWFKKKQAGKPEQVFFPDTSDGEYIDAPGTPTTPISITSSRLPSTSETISTTLEDPMTPLLSHFTHALEKALDHKELQNFALQIAEGMAHLEKIGVCHRDLAARNILINEFKTLKISDFGLSRSGPYVNHKTKKLPLRWMAIESIVNQTYDNKSDVWSYGVVLWEIGTLGGFPYQGVPDSFLLQFLQMGRRLERPEICTDDLYSLMKECWATDPEKRPTFADLVGVVDVKKQKVYVNFDQLNPTYVFPPSDTHKCTENAVQIVDISTNTA